MTAYDEEVAVLEEEQEEELEQEEEDGYSCDSCGCFMKETAKRYHCEECDDYDLCVSCEYVQRSNRGHVNEEEESEETIHPHPLTLLNPDDTSEGNLELDKALFEYRDKRASNSVFLSKVQGALPGSKTLSKHNIRSVLTVMDFDGQEQNKEELAPLLDMFYPKRDDDSLGEHKSLEVSKDGVVYHHIPLPDISDPARLQPVYGIKNLLEETSLWIELSLKYGNVLVHCIQGQRRSPTCVIAWLITRGYSVSEALKEFEERYNGGSKGWAEKYSNAKPFWIEELESWASSWKEKQVVWAKEHRDTLTQWTIMLKKHATAAKADAPSKRENSDDAEDQVPLTKKRKLNATS